MTALTVGSLFSGIGGFDLGFARAGLVPTWMCENDPAAQRVLAAHWPEVPCYADASILSGAACASVDVLCGGFPCQDVSVAGRRAGLAGERSGLWFSFLRLVGELGPRWVVIENVPGLLSSHGGRDFAVILRGLVECGYGVAWRILDAQYFGVAQRRRRVFLVASRGSGRAAEVLFESTGGSGDFAPGRAAGPGVAALTANGVGTCGADDNQAQAGHLIAVVGSLTACYAKGTDSDATDPLIIANALTASAGHHGHSSPRGDGSDNLVPVAGPFGVRRLMPVECEILQGFPPGWTDLPQPDSTRYRQLGNAVAVPVAEWLGARLLAAEEHA